jgi:hypothetical protein
MNSQVVVFHSKTPNTMIIAVAKTKETMSLLFIENVFRL